MYGTLTRHVVTSTIHHLRGGVPADRHRVGRHLIGRKLCTVAGSAALWCKFHMFSARQPAGFPPDINRC